METPPFEKHGFVPDKEAGTPAPISL